MSNTESHAQPGNQRAVRRVMETSQSHQEESGFDHWRWTLLESSELSSNNVLSFQTREKEKRTLRPHQI